MLDTIFSTWLGAPPTNFEFLEYIFKGIFFIIVFSFVADIFRMIRKLF